MGSRRWRRMTRYHWLLLAWAAAIFVASSIPGARLPHADGWNLDKLVHAIEFAVLGFLLVCALPTRWRIAGRVLVGIAIAVLYGVADELHQYLTPGRQPSVLDGVADTIGACVGVGLAAGFLLYRRSRDDSAGDDRPVPESRS